MNKDPQPSYDDKYANNALINNNDFQFDIPDSKPKEAPNQNQFFDFDFGAAGQANAAASNAYSSGQ